MFNQEKKYSGIRIGRAWMRAASGLALGGLVLGLAACGGGSGSSGGGGGGGGGNGSGGTGTSGLTVPTAKLPVLKSIGKGEGRLNLIAWEGYLAPKWVKPFENQTGCIVHATYAG